MLQNTGRRCGCSRRAGASRECTNTASSRALFSPVTLVAIIGHDACSLRKKKPGVRTASGVAADTSQAVASSPRIRATNRAPERSACQQPAQPMHCGRHVKKLLHNIALSSPTALHRRTSGGPVPLVQGFTGARSTDSRQKPPCATRQST